MATHRVKDRLLAASGLVLMMGLSCNGAVGQTPSVYTNGVAGYPAGVTYIPPQMPTYAGTPAAGLPSAVQLQQQQLLTAPQQMPGQSQAAFGTSTASAGVASSGMLPVDPPGGLGGYNYPGASAAGGIRSEMLARAARGTGLREGYAEEIERLNRSTEQYTASFDQRYDFRSMLIDGTVVPPVVTEMREVGQLEGDRVLKLSLGTFRIVQQARLALKVPDWRDYLFIPSKTGRQRPPEFLPRTDDERRLFDEAVAQGRIDGVREAQETYKQNMARLNRDYAGMQLYRELAAKGAVSLPKVSRSTQALALSEGGSRASVGNVNLTIQVTPTFKNAPGAAYLAGRAAPQRPEPARPAPAVSETPVAFAPPAAPPPPPPLAPPSPAPAPEMPRKTASAEAGAPLDIAPSANAVAVAPTPAPAPAPAASHIKATSKAVPTAAKPPKAPGKAAGEAAPTPAVAPVPPPTQPARKPAAHQFAAVPASDDLPEQKTANRASYELAKTAAAVAASPKASKFAPPPNSGPVFSFETTSSMQPASKSIDAVMSALDGGQ